MGGARGAAAHALPAAPAGGQEVSQPAPDAGQEATSPGREATPAGQESPPAGQEAPQAGQETARSPVVEGRLRLGDIPADSGTVVLHRVTPEEAGPVDSVQVVEGGAFQLELPHVPVRGSGEVFFASHRFEGILYFGPPLALAEQLDSVYTIQAYPTRAAPAAGIPFPVSVRNLFVEEGPMGWRVTDLVELRNDSIVTWVPDPEVPAAAVWRYPLPPEASAFRLGEGDLSPGSVTFEDGGVIVRAPVLPGDRLLVFHYELPSLETELPLPGTTGVLELLVRQPAPSLRVDRLQAAGPMEIERGVSYFRWWGEGLEDQVVRIRPGEDRGVPVAWIAVGLAFLLAVVGGWLVLRRTRPAGQLGGSFPEVVGEAGAPTRQGVPPGVPGAGAGPGPSGHQGATTPFARRRALLLTIAQLDEEAERAKGDGEPRSVQRERAARREALLAELEAVEVALRETGGDGSDAGQ
jgi:hypothetical protein